MVTFDQPEEPKCPCTLVENYLRFFFSVEKPRELADNEIA